MELLGIEICFKKGTNAKLIRKRRSFNFSNGKISQYYKSLLRTIATSVP